MCVSSISMSRGGVREVEELPSGVAVFATPFKCCMRNLGQFLCLHCSMELSPQLKHINNSIGTIKLGCKASFCHCSCLSTLKEYYCFFDFIPVLLHYRSREPEAKELKSSSPILPVLEQRTSGLHLAVTHQHCQKLHTHAVLSYGASEQFFRLFN